MLVYELRHTLSPRYYISTYDPASETWEDGQVIIKSKALEYLNTFKEVSWKDIEVNVHGSKSVRYKIIAN